MSEIVDPALRDARIDTTLVNANNLTFEVDQCGEGDRLALCLHGFPEHSFSWRYQLPMLAELGYKAWAPNMRGYGKSSRPPFVEDYRMDNLLDDVAHLIDASGCDETVLIAHDWGAAIAWMFAIREMRPLTKLVICNVPHPASFRRALRRPEQLRKSWYVFFFQIPWLPEALLGRAGARRVGDAIYNSCVDKSRFPPEVLDVYRRNAAQPGALRSMINYYRAAIRGRRETRSEDLAVIKTPTLMIWGEEDVALTRASTLDTGEFVEDLQVRYLPRVSHWVQQEAPEAVNAMIRAFLLDEPVPEMSWEMRLDAPAAPVS